MQCQKENIQTIDDLALSQNDFQEVGDIPLQCQENLVNPAIPNLNQQEQQIANSQPIESISVQNINDILEIQQDSSLFLDSQFNGSSDLLDQPEEMLDEMDQENEQPLISNFINDQQSDDQQYVPVKSIEFNIYKNQTPAQIVKKLHQNDIQVSSLNEEEFKSKIPVVCKLDQDQQIIEIDINESIIYMSNNKHFYIRNCKKRQQKNRKMLQKLNDFKKNQNQSE